MDNTSNRELRSSRSFQTPIERMWNVWTKPDLIINWWGPKGFTHTIEKMEFWQGGEWKFIMHGPDGTNFPNRSVYREIKPFEKIVFEHFNPHFIATVIFESIGPETLIDWTLLFDTADMRDIIVNAHKADKGQEENFDKLEECLTGLTSPNDNPNDIT